MQRPKNTLRGTGASKHPWVTASTACPGTPSSPASSGAARCGQEPHLPAWPLRMHIPAPQGEGTSPGTQHPRASVAAAQPPGSEQKRLRWVQGMLHWRRARGQPRSPSAAHQKPASPGPPESYPNNPPANATCSPSLSQQGCAALCSSHTRAHRQRNAPNLHRDALAMFYPRPPTGVQVGPRGHLQRARNKPLLTPRSRPRYTKPQRRRWAGETKKADVS